MSTPLQFNEYIVFDQDRIRIKFIVHCERGSSSSYVASTMPRSAFTGMAYNQNSIVPRLSASTVRPSNSGLTSSQANYSFSTRPATSTVRTPRSVFTGTTYNQNYTAPRQPLPSSNIQNQNASCTIL